MNNFLSNWWNKGRNVRIPNESTAGWGQLWTDDRNQLGKSDANYQAGRRGNPFGRPDQAFNPFRSAEKGGPGSGPTPLVRQLGERVLGPVATGASLFSLGQEGSPLEQATEAMPDLQIGQFGISNNPQTDIGQRTGDFLVNQLGNAYEQFDDFGSGVRENLAGGPKWFLDEFKSRLPAPPLGWGHHPMPPKPAPGWGHQPGSVKDFLLRPGQEGTFGPIGIAD